MALFDRLNRALNRRIAYRRTRKQLKSLPLDVALDLDIYHGDADRIARRAVYGH